MRTRLFPIILMIYLIYYLFIYCGGDLAQWCGGRVISTHARGFRFDPCVTLCVCVT